MKDKDKLMMKIQDNALHVAGVVQNALTVIGEAMAKLQAGKEVA